MTHENEAEAVAKGLSDGMKVAICDFEPGVWYCTAMPTKRASGYKGHMVRKGLAEHDGAYGGDGFYYGLTPLGLAVRQAILTRDKP